MGQTSAIPPDVVAIPSLSARITPARSLKPPANSGADALHEVLARTRTAARPGSDPTPGLIQQEIAELEHYVVTYPDSPYTPGLRQALGEFHRTQGRYSKALTHWRTAWSLTKGHSDGAGKQIGDRTLAFMARQLASLGRVEELGALAAEVGQRRLDGGPLSVMWRESLEALAVMRTRPEISYRCGILALNNVARAMTGRPVASSFTLSLRTPGSAWRSWSPSPRNTVCGCVQPFGNPAMPLSFHPWFTGPKTTMPQSQEAMETIQKSWIQPSGIARHWKMMPSPRKPAGCS